jgi:hypothetical protein
MMTRDWFLLNDLKDAAVIYNVEQTGPTGVRGS